MDPFSQLPQELVHAICHNLPESADLQSLRLCNKLLKEKSLTAFYDLHFKLVKVTLTRDSLQQLITLLQNERLARSVKELEFVYVTFNDESRSRIHNSPVTQAEIDDFELLMSKLGLDPKQYKPQPFPPRFPEPPKRHPEVAAWEAKLRRRRRRLHDKHMHDQNHLRASGIDVELFTSALHLLPALRTIRTVWKLETGSSRLDRIVLGVRHLRNDIGIWPLTSTSTHLVPFILSSLLRSGKTLDTLIIRDAPYTLPLAKTPTARKPSRSATPATTFAQSQLHELSPIKLRHLFIFFSSSDSDPTLDTHPSSWLGPLYNSMPSLHSLSITFDFARPCNETLRSLAEHTPRACQLRSLAIDGSDVDVATLKQVVVPQGKTLRKLVCSWPRDVRDAGEVAGMVAREMEVPELRQLWVQTSNLFERRMPVKFDEGFWEHARGVGEREMVIR